MRVCILKANSKHRKMFCIIVKNIWSFLNPWCVFTCIENTMSGQSNECLFQLKEKRQGKKRKRKRKEKQIRYQFTKGKVANRSSIHFRRIAHHHPNFTTTQFLTFTSIEIAIAVQRTAVVSPDITSAAVDCFPLSAVS